MKTSFYISVATAAISLILAIVVLVIGYSNQGLQTEIQVQQKDIQKQQGELQKQQEQINTGQQIQQKVGPALLQEMGEVSLKNEKMKELLKTYGISVQPRATPAPTGDAATPHAPAAPATAPALR